MNADWTGGPDKLLEADQQRKDVARRFRNTQVPMIKLWTYYYGLGGDADEMSLDAYLNEALHLPAAQVGLIATAMRELSEDED
ncbi:hypothetical protein [Pseudarthrobacter sp. NIBRBAC000502770]|jgi:hypothetical protein|uniref:hypothetical protein n=1 Tax=Pseudarthrobacter sp. NIBRBAC000502770 TaxID=2590785 RepID=UPI0011402BCD|nr:hypothetical protein [Pseudarthrobacter sp. NIBRBAC000502770]QDG89692.1 hypothetical protein NIBR502770_15280 [Pseudarthrobacter sp. NIBRBAC000502770]